LERTADFATSLDLDAVSLFSATPLPGTELWQMAKGARMPESVDFRTPQVNLTPLSDARYAEVYGRIRKRLDDYNQSQMMRSLGASAAVRVWPAPGLR